MTRKATMTREFYTSGYTRSLLDEETGAEIWHKDNADASYGLGFSGKKSAPDFNLGWSGATRESRRHDFEQGWLREIRTRAADKKARAASRKSGSHNLQVGDILVSLWGYDQSNVEFYQVRDVRGKLVTFTRIASKTVERSEGHDHDRVMPLKDEFIGESFQKRPDNHNRVRLTSYCYARPWGGGSMHRSWGA